MKTSVLALGLMIAFSASAAQDWQQLNNPETLKRASFVIRGHGPSPAEYRALDKVTPADRPAAIADTSARWVMTDDFVSRMTNNLSYLFRIKPPSNQDGTPARYSTLHLLFDRIVREDRSWDELLVSGTVGLTNQDRGDGLAGVDFFRNAANPDELAKLNAYLRDNRIAALATLTTGNTQTFQADPSTSPALDFTSDRVAGVLSDPHFASRFPTNPVNQNRKRAAAIFRIFLCDEMQAVTLPDEAVQKDLDAVGFDGQANSTGGAVHGGDVHATDPKCSSCHYKLDPLANVFRGVSDHLPSRTSPGALTFKRRTGELVSIPFNSARELGRALTQQPEYASCQVRHFWDWFVGEDVVMNERVEADLLREFDRVGRRPREFARYLVNLPEFRSFPILRPDTINVNHVSRLLRDCTACHTTEKAAPDYRQIPFLRFGVDMPAEMNQRMHDYNLDALVTTLDLLGDGSKVTMPPLIAGWHVSSADRTRLLAWLGNGAPDASGKPTWTNADLRAEVSARVRAENISFSYRPTQGWTARRRQSPNEVNQTLRALVTEIGLPPSTISGQNPSSPINLTTGAPLKAIGAEYTRAVQQQVSYFMAPLSQAVFDATPAASSLGLDLKHLGKEMMIRELTLSLWGMSPAPGSPEWIRLDKYIDALPGYDLRVKILPLVQQMLINEKFLVY